MDTELKTMNTKELTEAVGRLIEREDRRESQARRKKRRRIRQKRDRLETSIVRLAQSVEVIKWCIVSISTVMTISIIVLILVIWQIGNEAQRIKGEVETVQKNIEREANAIREKIQNPIRTLGASIGGRIDKELGIFGGEESEE